MDGQASIISVKYHKTQTNNMKQPNFLVQFFALPAISSSHLVSPFKNMKNQIVPRKNVLAKLGAFALLNSLLITAALGAQPTISVNFTGCCNDGLTPAPTSLLPAEAAGVVPLPNWNNLTGNNVHDAVLNDSNGTPTAVTIFYDADEQWGSNTGLGDPNAKLFNGYLGLSNDGQYRPLFLHNVPNGAYKLLLYNVGGRQDSAYTINGNTSTTLHIVQESAGDYLANPVFRRGTSTNPGARDICNYAQFDEIAPINGTITIDCRSEAFRGFMNGIQLIPMDPGAFRFTDQPADATRDEEGSVSFYGNAVDGAGTITYQWLTNGVADTVNGLTQTYTRTALAANENGRTFALVATDSTSLSVTSRTAVLTVNKVSKMISASSAGRTNRVFIRFSKEVSLTGVYTLDNGATVFSAAYGPTHRDVVLSTSILVEGTLYTVTATGEIREDDGSPMNPEPNTITFLHGFGRICTDFATLPAGTALFNNGVTGSGYLGDDGTGTNMVVHLTDDGNNGAYGKLYISNRTGGAVLKVLDAKWRVRIGGDLGGHADGMTFSWADNLAADGNFVAVEEGEGNGVSFVIDTWDGGSGPDTGIDIKWQGVQLPGSFLHIPRTFEGNNNFICQDTFVSASASVNSAGVATFTYNGNTVSAVIPGWTGIVNGAFAYAARTGGENDNFWIDDVCINNFTLGPVFFTLEPVEQTVLEGQTATFTAAVDGSPSYSYQWFTNGVPVPGATGSTYTTPPATAAYEGRLYSVMASNGFSSVTSSNATLHVQLNPRVVSVFSSGTREVHVIFTRPVTLGPDFGPPSYDFDNGAFESSRRYGASHSEVIITTDADLLTATTYLVTISDVADESNAGNLLIPNPTVVGFRNGYGSVCADFATGLPPGASVSGSAVVSGGFLHITDAVNGQGGNFFVPDPNGGFPVDRLKVGFKLQLGGGTCCGARYADGMSFNVASDVTAASNYGEEGTGSGLTITFDTWDNAAPDTAPAIEVRYKGTVVAFQATAGITEGGRPPSGPYIFDASGSPLSLDTSNTFQNVLLIVGPDGKLDLYFKGITIFNKLQLPNYTPFVGANFGFGARTGGANENAWIDDLCINAFSLGAVTITSQPSDVTVNENPPGRGSFTVGVDGLPPYSAQWYSNGVALAGATGLSYLTPPLNRLANGAGYFAIISNQFNSVTSRTAIVTIIPDNVAPSLLSALSDCTSNVYVRFTKTLEAASANNPANYTINNGVIVTAASLYANGRLVVLTVSPGLNPYNYSVLTVNGVRDVSPFPNATVNAQIVILAKTPLSASGANNLVVVEAEDYDVNRSPSTQTPLSSWAIASSLPGFVGSGYVDSTPNTGEFSGNTPDQFTNANRLDYCINFPVAGTYYLWARGSTANDGGNNSFHFGIDGVSPDEFSRRVGNRISNWGGNAGSINDFGWVRDVNGTGAGSFARIAIAAPGVHTLSIWQREDGLKLDRFLLTTDSAFTLAVTDIGPTASLRPATRTLSIVGNGDGSTTVSWPGAGYRLQGTDVLNSNPALTVWQNLPYTSPLVIPAGFFGTGNTNVFFRLIAP